MSNIILRAPLFGTLVKQLHASGRKVILDLGPVQGASVDLFNQLNCRLEIADLSAGLENLNTQEDHALLKEQVGHMMPGQEDEKIDVVLCWDLMNYFQRPVLKTVMEKILSRVQPGALVHALIAYSSKHMPAQPCLYYPAEAFNEDTGMMDHLEVKSVTKEECDAPQYTPENLTRSMPGSRIERAVLLSNGMQEFLFKIS